MRLHTLVAPALAILLVTGQLPAQDGKPDTRPRLDVMGDPLPNGAVARLGTVRFRQDAVIWGAVFSRDGQEIAAAGQDPVIRVWDAATGKPLRPFGWSAGPGRIALAPDGKHLAVGGTDGDIHLWDLQAQAETRHWSTGAGLVFHLAFAADGKSLITASEDQSVRVWDTATGKERRHFERLAGVWPVALSADGKTALVSGNGVVLSLDVASGREERRAPVGGKNAPGFLSPDGKLWAGVNLQGASRSLAVWDVEAGKELSHSRGELPEYPSVLAFAPDGKLLATAGGLADVIRLWDTATGEPVRQLKGVGKRLLHSIAFFPDGRTLVAAGNDRSLRRWDVTTGEMLGQLEGHLAGVQSLALSADGKILAAASRDNTIRLFDWDTRRELRQLPAQDPAVNRVAFAGDGKLLASAGQSPTVRLWDVATGKELRTFQGHKGLVTALAVSPNGEMVASSGPAPRLWQADSGKERARLAEELFAGAVVFTADNKGLIAVGPDNTLRVWSTDSGKQQRSWPAGAAETHALALSPDGKLLAVGGNDGLVAVHDVAAGKEVWQARAHPGAVNGLAFSRDGKRLVTGGLGGALRVWDPATGKELLPAPGHQGMILDAVFCDRGRVLATVGQDRSLRLWEPRTGKELRAFAELPGPQGLASLAAFSADGNVLAVQGLQGALSTHVCAVATGRPVRALAEKRMIGPAALSPTGNQVVTRWFSGMQLWDVAGGKEIGRLPDDAQSVVFSPGGDLLACLGRDPFALRLWSAAARKEVHSWRVGAPGQIEGVRFSADGRTLAARRVPGWVSLFEVRTGGERLRFRVGPTGLSAVAVAPGQRLLAASESGQVGVWDLAPPALDRGLRLPEPGPGKELARFEQPGHHADHLLFSPDGTLLVSAARDGTALVWDVQGVRVDPEKVKPGIDELEPLWAALAEEDAARAYRAVWLLAAVPDVTVALFRERLPEKRTAAAAVVERLLGRLGDKDAGVRDKAAAELWKLGKGVEPAVAAALAAQTDPAVRQSVERLLAKLRGWVPPPGPLRAWRAVEVLEMIGTAEARQVLEELARAEDAELARTAKEALQRLSGRETARP